MATITKSLTIESQGTYNLTFDLWSYSEWATSAGITTSYASLAALIADEKAVRQLMTVHASVDYFANCPDSTIISTVINNDLCAKWINLRDYALDTLSAKSNIKSVMDTADKYGYGEWGKIDSTTWAPLGNVPIMTANNAPYGTAIRSSVSIDYYEAFHVFDNSDIQRVWIPAQGATNNYIGYTFINPVKVKSLHFVARIFGMSSVTFTVQGSNDGFVNDIHDITTFTTQSATTEIKYETDIDVDSSDYYLSYRIFSASATYVNNNSALLVATLQFYGRELTVRQTSAPTDGREYVHIGSDYYTEDWGEKEFATGSTRKTIYDHGVEPYTQVKTYTYGSGELAEKLFDRLHLYQPSQSQSIALVYIENEDVHTYTMFAKIGSRLQVLGNSNDLIRMSFITTLPTNSYIVTDGAFALIRPPLTDTKVSLSGENTYTTNPAIRINTYSSSAGGEIDIKEWWLE